MNPRNALTKTILDALSDVIDISKVKLTVDPDQPAWEHIDLCHDHNIGFDVTENDIITYNFGRHSHFGLDVERAVASLRQFFTQPLRKIEYQKGMAIIQVEWCFINGQNQLQQICVDYHPWPKGLLSMFAKKRLLHSTWQWNISAGCFLELPEDDRVVSYHDIGFDILIAVLKINGAYTYQILELTFDDETGTAYWTTVLWHSSYFGTVQEALSDAKAAVRSRKKA